MRLLGLIFSVMAVAILAAAPAMAERRLALVIGNSSYRNTPDLLNPKNDANEMAKALNGLGFKVIRGIDLSVDGMRRTVREFADALQSSDVALFYYAGHGLQVNGQNYLVPVDAKMRSSLDLEFEATNLQVVIDLMEREAMTNLVFLDACRDNPLARTLARLQGELGQCPKLFVQVNTGEEPQKAGVLPGEADALVALCRELGVALS